MRKSKLIITAIVTGTLFALPVLAAPEIGMQFADGMGLPSFDIRTMVAGVIRSLLGFIGLLLVLIIMMGGFKLMTSGGNEERRAEAMATIKNGIIGMLLIMMSSSISNFVVDAVMNAADNHFS